MTKIRSRVILKDLTTMKVGGPAKYFVDVKSKDDLFEAVKFARTKKIKIFVLGDGSNLLISDAGISRLVIHFVNKSISFSGEMVNAEAGANWDDLVDMAVSKNLQGIECLSGIPGTVGAAPVQNIGAYGTELVETFDSLVAFDLKKNDFVEFSDKSCCFDYRDSIFKQSNGRYLVWSLKLKLNKNAPPKVSYEALENYLSTKGISDPTLVDVRQAVLAIRAQKLENPDLVPNAGSYFKNPIVEKETLEKLTLKYPDIPSFENGDKVKIPAAWLIEKCGLKGFKHKDIGISPKHALVIVNPEGKGTSTQVKELEKIIVSSVLKTFGIKLSPEVSYIK